MNGDLYKIDPRIDPAQTAILRAHLDGAGWRPTSGQDWSLFWSMAVHDLGVFRRLGDGQRVNHFPGVGPLFYKDELAHFLGVAEERFAAEGVDRYGFHPEAFSMPRDYDRLVAAMADRPGAYWLKKQKRWMAGEGMGLIMGPEEIPRDEEWLVQRYVANPLLLPGHPYKHVLRPYVVVTSLDPLVAYLHPNGVVKFTSRPFGLSPEELRDPGVHLTNPPVQRLNTDVEEPVVGTDFDDYRARLRAAGIDDGLIFDAIRSLLIETLLALRDPVLRLSREWSPRLDCSFELLGFDVMIDDTLRPWLLECNISPALGARGQEGTPTFEAQRRVKDSVAGDMLRLIGAFDGEFDSGSGPERFVRERARAAAYDLLYPAADAAEYLACLPSPTRADLAMVEVAAPS